jgi:predicted phosphodiesterase
MVVAMRMNGKALWGVPFTLILLGAVVAAAIPRHAAQAVAPSDAGTPLAITHGPYLQLPSADSMTVVWHTNRKCVSRVEYGLDETAGMTAVSSHNGLIDNDRTSHIIMLTGLKPGTTYKYRVVSKEFIGYEKQHIVKFGESITSPWYQFTTLNPALKEFSFSVVSDIHERVKDLETMLDQKYFQGVDFVVYNGDMLNDFMQVEQVFAGFLDASVRIFAKERPFLFIRGNHEVRGRYARSLPDYFPSRDGQAYFAFNHAGVHFLVLDSGEDKEDTHEYYNGLVDFQDYRKEQAAWLKKELESDACRKARFRIVFSHVPPRGGSGFAIQEVRQNFEPPLNEAGIDLWLSGHTHRFLRVDPTEGQNRYTLIVGATDTITRVDVSQDRLRVSGVRQNGEVVLPPLQLERRQQE